jgi:UDP-3-O-[3-hydroxymyristoyl] glucosamine N-acyltransferase
MEYDIDSLLLNLGNNSYTSQGIKKKVKGYASITEATENDISFCWYDGERALSLISNSNAGVILCKKSLEGHILKLPLQKQILFVDDPRLAFIQVIEVMQKKERKTGISSTAILSDTAKIGSNCYIGEYTIIRDNCVIGDNTTIGDRVTLLEDCSIGNNCILQSGVVVGADSFSYVRNSNGDIIKFPNSKGVKIGNNVDIFANSLIERGLLADTIIGDGSKIGGLVVIAHNSTIGKKCQIVDFTIVGGSVSIGDMCYLGINSTIKNNLKMGNNVIVAAGAVVIKNVEDNDIVAGNPAKSIRDKVKLSSTELFLMTGQKKDE